MSRRILALPLLILTVSCGDPTDRPEDCTPDEYFDESVSLCRVCPAATEPQCDDGCGFQVVEDDRGCPAVQCITGDQCLCAADDEECIGCTFPDYFNTESLTCEPCDGPVTCEAEATPARYVSGDNCTLRCP